MGQAASHTGDGCGLGHWGGVEQQDVGAVDVDGQLVPRTAGDEVRLGVVGWGTRAEGGTRTAGV